MLEIMSLNVNQFGRFDKRNQNNLNEYILSKVTETNTYLKGFFEQNTNGIAILHEVVFERKNYTASKAYEVFCQYWRNKDYSVKEMDMMDEKKRHHAIYRTIAITKNKEVTCKTNGFSVDSTGLLRARWVELEYRDYTILGVHVPQGEYGIYTKEFKAVLLWDAIIIDAMDKLQHDQKLIIIGDFNTNIQKPSTNTQRMGILKNICIQQKKIIDVWEYAVHAENAYTINQNNQEQLCKVIDEPTFVAGTRIDYAFCSNDIILEKMIVDDRTLGFTDHSAIRMLIKTV